MQYGDLFSNHSQPLSDSYNFDPKEAKSTTYMDLSLFKLPVQAHRILLSLFLLAGFSASSQVSITCPINIVTTNDPGDCGAIVTYIAPEGTGSGTNITTTQTAGLPSGSFFPSGPNLLEFTVTNDEGDSDVCIYYVDVHDGEDPLFDCPDDIVVDAPLDLCEAVVFFDDPTATDNCILINVIQIGGLPSGSTFPIGESNIDYSAVDDSGNFAFCRFKIIVNDITDPTITCPENINLVVVTACDTIVNYVPPVGSDICTTSNTVQTGGIGPGGSFPVGTTTETFTVTDLAGNTSSCSFDVVVADGAPPVITCPADVLVIANPGDCEAVVTFSDATATDNCSLAGIGQTGGLPSGATFPVGTHIIEFTAFDDATNSATCTFLVEVAENEIPEITCPADIEVTNDPGECGAIVGYVAPEGTDDCGGATTVLTSGLGPGGTFPVGTTTETYTVTDISGNQASCSFDITVTDSENPSITCPADIVASVDLGNCNAVVNFPSPVALDNCPGVVVTQTAGPISGSIFPTATTFIEFTAEDAEGNTATCNFNITVIDDENPSITCPLDQTIVIPNGFCSGVISYPDPVVTDNCPGSSFILVSGPANGDVVAAGDYIVELQALDATGNTANCTFNISVTETSDPEITCPADLTVANDPGQCDAIVTFLPPDATDSCSAVTVTQTAGPVSGSTFPLGSTSVEFTAEDEYGNSATCSNNIIVEDQEDPVITCPTDISVFANSALCEAQVTFADPIPTDNCPGVTILQTSGPISGSDFPVGITLIEYTAEDAAGNTSTCTFNIEVVDNENPVITCPADQVIVIPGGFCSTTIAYADPVITDNCPGSTFVVISGPASGDDVSAGDYTIELQAIDASGNTANCTFNISVSETSDPVFDCPEDLEVIADPGTCETTVTFTSPTATDSCSAVTVTQTGGPVSGTVFPAGATLLTFTAEDEFGNTATCSYNIIVVDDVDPTIICPEDLISSNAPGICGAIVNYLAPVVDDNCGIASVTQSEGLGSGSLFPVGETTETYVVTDVSGNTAECSFTVTIIDDELPTIVCPADEAIVLADGDCDIVVNYAAPITDDNCGIASVTLLEGIASGELFPVGNTTVTYEVEDLAGNTAQCSFNVSVAENVDPEITCPLDIEVSNEPGECSAIVNYTAPEGTDNCGIATTTLTAGLGSGSAFPVGVTIETYTVTDPSGNTVSCSFTITVLDDENPVITCPEDIIVGNDPSTCDALVNYPDPTALDNCTDALIPVLISGPASGSTFPVGTTTIIYEATDAAGNSETCSFDVIVEDQEFPIITCPADVFIDAASGDCDAIVNYDPPIASDNCPGVVVTMITGIASGEPFPVGSTTVEFQAMDDAGNSDFCSFVVTVSEDVPPTIDCPADIVSDNDLGVCGAIVDFTPPVGVDNCGDAVTELIAGLEPGSEFPVGITTVTYQVTDISGNQTDCSFQVEVLDAELPLFDCPTDQIFDADENCGLEYNFDAPSASDNCTGVLIIVQTVGPPTGTVLPLGNTPFEFSATDEAGNVAICGFVVTVVDNESPVFTSCPADAAIFVQADACDALVSYNEPTATDNCEVTIEQVSGPANNSILPPGFYEYSYTVTDDAGNISNCDFTITVIDNIAPSITCQESFETCETEPTFDIASATDNCSIDQIVQIEGPESGSVFPVGENTITFEATDVYGNTSSCSFVITVLENAPRADAGNDVNICGETSVTLNGNDPENSLGTWTLLSGSGDIEFPNEPTTDVSNIGVGENSFIWSLDPENGCEIDQDTVLVILETGVVVDAGDDVLLEVNGSAVLFPTTSPDGGDYLWSPADGLNCIDCESPVANPDETTLYYMTYTTPLGCEMTDSVYVRVFIEFPNTITPDGDGVNDVWNIPGIENYPDVYVVIYNRWGNQVFESVGYHDPWDGQKEGDDLPTASYFYVIDYKVSGKEVLNGTVNIIR